VTNRWDDYSLTFEGSHDSLEAAWEEAGTACGGKRSMLVLGVGFDPRALAALRLFLALKHKMTPLVGLIRLPPPSESGNRGSVAMAEDNQQAFDGLTSQVDVREIPHQDVLSPPSAGPRIARALTDPTFVEGVGHLIVDISSLPASLYFPTVTAVLRAVDEGRAEFPAEVQVVACENPAIDARIRELGIGPASVLGGYRHVLDRESGPHGTTIWAPVVGEHSGPALRAIHEFLEPADVCPILPFPARDPRRADNLLLELQVELLDMFGVTPGNLIYADERNPFDLYRTLTRVHEKYVHALHVLGPTTVALSTHSSKLLSLGALLAAHEHALPVVAAPALDYEVETEELADLEVTNQVTCAWLTGVPYR
jgi:hypothetical protein